MSIEVKVPVLPESVADATVAAWHKKPGDSVHRDENLLDLETGTNLTEMRRDGLRSEKLASNEIDDLFEYLAPDAKATVTVITDIDCPYCRRLHQQMADYHALGISVRYLMMPRSGPDTLSFEKANHAACAPDREPGLCRRG